MHQDMPVITGGEHVGLKARGRTFDLWVNCVRTNRQMGSHERLPEEQAKRVQEAARGAAAAAGVSKREIEGREFIALYPECRDEATRIASRKGLEYYLKHAPDRGTCARWTAWLAGINSRAAAVAFNARTAVINYGALSDEQLIADLETAQRVAGPECAAVWRYKDELKRRQGVRRDLENRREEHRRRMESLDVGLLSVTRLRKLLDETLLICGENEPWAEEIAREIERKTTSATEGTENTEEQTEEGSDAGDAEVGDRGAAAKHKAGVRAAMARKRAANAAAEKDRVPVSRVDAGNPESEPGTVLGDGGAGAPGAAEDDRAAGDGSAGPRGDPDERTAPGESAEDADAVPRPGLRGTGKTRKSAAHKRS